MCCYGDQYACMLRHEYQCQCAVIKICWHDNEYIQLPLHARNDHDKVLLASKLLHVGGEGEKSGDLTAKERQQSQQEGPAVVVTN